MRYKVYRRKRALATAILYISFLSGFVLMGAECQDLRIQLMVIGIMFSCYGIAGLCYRYLNRLERRYRYYAGRHQHRSKRYA